MVQNEKCIISRSVSSQKRVFLESKIDTIFYMRILLYLPTQNK